MMRRLLRKRRQRRIHKDLLVVLGAGLEAAQRLELWATYLVYEQEKKSVTKQLDLDQPREAAEGLLKRLEDLWARGESRSSRTLGAVFRELHDEGDELQDLLEKLLERRNFLVHGFYEHYAPSVLTTEGLLQAREEANDIALDLRSGAALLKRLTMGMAHVPLTGDLTPALRRHRLSESMATLGARSAPPKRFESRCM